MRAPGNPDRFCDRQDSCGNTGGAGDTQTGFSDRLGRRNGAGWEGSALFRGMGKEETSDFLRALQRKGAEGLLAGCRERMYTNSRRFEHSPRLHTAIIRDFEKPTGEEACQVFFRLGSEEEVRGLKEVFPFFDWLRYRDGTYAVTAKGVSKASALLRRRRDMA